MHLPTYRFGIGTKWDNTHTSFTKSLPYCSAIVSYNTTNRSEKGLQSTLSNGQCLFSGQDQLTFEIIHKWGEKLLERKKLSQGEDLG